VDFLFLHTIASLIPFGLLAYRLLQFNRFTNSMAIYSFAFSLSHATMLVIVDTFYLKISITCIIFYAMYSMNYREEFRKIYKKKEDLENLTEYLKDLENQIMDLEKKDLEIRKEDLQKKEDLEKRIKDLEKQIGDLQKNEDFEELIGDKDDLEEQKTNMDKNLADFQEHKEKQIEALRKKLLKNKDDIKKQQHLKKDVVDLYYSQSLLNRFLGLSYIMHE